MGKVVAHMMMSSVRTGVIITTQYWCGKVDRFIDDPNDIPTAEEQIKLDTQEAKLRANFPPTCKRCRATKERHTKEAEGGA